MQCYGYLFGKLKLIKDLHHDEVFIEKTQLVVMANNVWLFTDKELYDIVKCILKE